MRKIFINEALELVKILVKLKQDDLILRDPNNELCFKYDQIRKAEICLVPFSIENFSSSKYEWYLGFVIREIIDDFIQTYSTLLVENSEQLLYQIEEPVKFQLMATKKTVEVAKTIFNGSIYLKFTSDENSESQLQESYNGLFYSAFKGSDLLTENFHILQVILTRCRRELFMYKYSERTEKRLNYLRIQLESLNEFLEVLNAIHPYEIRMIRKGIQQYFKEHEPEIYYTINGIIYHDLC